MALNSALHIFPKCFQISRGWIHLLLTFVFDSYFMAAILGLSWIYKSVELHFACWIHTLFVSKDQCLFKVKLNYNFVMIVFMPLAWSHLWYTWCPTCGKDCSIASSENVCYATDKAFCNECITLKLEKWDYPRVCCAIGVH